MALVQAEETAEHFESISLPGNESDTSYDMSEDIAHVTAPEIASSSDGAFSEAHEIIKKGKKNVSKDEESLLQATEPDDKAAWAKHAQITAGDDFESITSVRSSVDGSRINPDNEFQVIEEEEEEEEEEQFYDMIMDKKVTEYRNRFLKEVDGVLNVLDRNLGKEQVELAGVIQHTRAIAALFGDNIQKLRHTIHSLKVSYAQASSSLAQHQAAIRSYKDGILVETESRRKLETKYFQAMQSAQRANASYKREKSKLTTALGGIETANACLEHDIENYRHQLEILQSKACEAEVDRSTYKKEITTLQACKADLEREAEKCEFQIHAYQLSLQEAETQQRRERCIMEELRQRQRKEESDGVALIQAMRDRSEIREKSRRREERERKSLLAQIRQLDIVRQDQAQELDCLTKTHKGAIEAIQVEKLAKETAIIENNILHCQVPRLLSEIEDLKSNCSTKVEAETRARDATRLENESLKKEIASLRKELDDTKSQHTASEKRGSDARLAAVRESNKIHNELVRTRNKLQTIRAELKEYQTALRDIMEERKTGEEKHKETVKELEEKISHLKTQVERLRNSIQSMVIKDGQQADAIEKLHSELIETDSILELLEIDFGDPSSPTDRQNDAPLLDHKTIYKAEIDGPLFLVSQYRKRNKLLQEVGEELLKTRQKSSILVGQKHALLTRVVLLEEQIASAETLRKNVHSNIESFIQEVNKDAETERLVELMEVLREMERRSGEVTGREVISAVQDLIATQIKKIENVDTQYRDVLSALFQASKTEDESTTDPDSIPEDRRERAATIAQKFLDNENIIEKLCKCVTTQSHTHKTTLSTLQEVQQVNKTLSTSHDAALNELRERRDQIAEFEALQQVWAMKDAKTTAQLKLSKTEVRCLQDLHDIDKIEIERLIRQVRSLRRGIEASVVEHVEDAAVISCPSTGNSDNDAGYAGRAEEHGQAA